MLHLRSSVARATCDEHQLGRERAVHTHFEVAVTNFHQQSNIPMLDGSEHLVGLLSISTWFLTDRDSSAPPPSMASFLSVYPT